MWHPQWKKSEKTGFYDAKSLNEHLIEAIPVINIPRECATRLAPPAQHAAACTSTVAYQMSPTV